MSLVGKLTGADWSLAPEGTTYARSGNPNFYKYENNKWYCWQHSHWFVSREYFDKDQLISNSNGIKLIPKEEDLGLNNKEVKSINDIEVGMFLKKRNNDQIVVVGVKGRAIFHGIGLGVGSTVHGWHNLQDFYEWSYTYNEPYYPIVKPTEQEIAIQKANEEINEAKKALLKAEENLKLALQSK